MKTEMIYHTIWPKNVKLFPRIVLRQPVRYWLRFLCSLTRYVLVLLFLPVRRRDPRSESSHGGKQQTKKAHAIRKGLIVCWLPEEDSNL